MPWSSTGWTNNQNVIKLLDFMAALGIARARAAQSPVEKNDAGDVGEPAVVEGVSGTWRVDPSIALGRWLGLEVVLPKSAFERHG